MQLDDQSGQPFFYPPIPADELFGGLSVRGRKHLGTLLRHKSFVADEEVFYAGDAPDSVYMLTSGVAQLSSPVYAIGSGQIFGVTEALSGNNFEMSLRTVTACEFDVIDRSDLFKFLLEESEVCFRLAAAVSELYRKTISCLRTLEK